MALDRRALEGEITMPTRACRYKPGQEPITPACVCVCVCVCVCARACACSVAEHPGAGRKLRKLT